ncbi:hypothetical protein [Paenibacillus dokdonensis]|uniref:hypothetical protein n=1 Tax=Paenibacillus dokdonensis TaxID=2567944 RepID=UPI003D28D410
MGLREERIRLQAADSRQHQVDEVKVFETFGGDLPVIHHSRKPKTENGWATVHTTSGG